MRTIPISEFNERRKNGEILSKDGEKIKRPLDYMKTKRKKGVEVEAPKVDPNAKLIEAVERIKIDSGANSKSIVNMISGLVEKISDIQRIDSEKRIKEWDFEIDRDEKTKLMTHIKVKAVK